MPNYINKIKLPNNDVYEIQDANALPKTTQINGTSADSSTGNYTLTGDDIKLSSTYVVPQTYTPPVAGVTSVEDSIANLVKHIDDAVAGGITSVDEAANSHLDITTATGGAVTVDVATGYVIPSTTVGTPASGGTDVSLVSTGNMFTWNDKQSGITMDIPDTEHPEQTVTTRIVDGNKNTKLIGGTAVTLTPDTANGTITINSSDTTYSDFVGSGTGHAAGLVPDPGSTAGDSKFLCEDGSWTSPSVTVAGDSTDTVVSTAKLVAGSNVTITPDTTNHTVTIASTGSGGTTDYTQLQNLPTINTHTVTGAMTSSDLGLQSALTFDGTYDASTNKVATVSTVTGAITALNLGTASTKTADTEITSADDDTTVPTSKAVYGFVTGQGYLTNADGNIFSESNNGLVPAADGTGETGMFLKGDGTWATPENTTYESKTAASGGIDVSLVTTGEKYTWNQKQDALTFDDTPTASSNNPVKSGGVYTALSGKLGTSDNAASAAKLNNGSSDYSVGSTSKGVYFSNGVPTEMTCSVETNVPQNAVFTDTTYTGTGAISINSSNVISVADGAVGTKGVVELSTSIPATASSAVDTKVATEKAVATAIEALPEPMVFRGTLGTGGTITSLPVDGTAGKGDTYKVITAGTYAGETAKIGDTFICNTKTASANTWVLIPSGDEPSGTVTNIATSVGITTASGSAITDTGTLKLKLKSETALSGSVLTPDTTTAKIYPATVDKDGYVSVPVPWTDTNTTYSFTYSGTKLTISANS